MSLLITTIFNERDRSTSDTLEDARPLSVLDKRSFIGLEAQFNEFIRQGCPYTETEVATWIWSLWAFVSRRRASTVNISTVGSSRRSQSSTTSKKQLLILRTKWENLVMEKHFSKLHLGVAPPKQRGRSQTWLPACSGYR